MPNAELVIIIVTSNSYAPMLFCFRWKPRNGRSCKNGGKGLKGEEESESGRERDVKCCPPGYQKQWDARSQTYEEAIVLEHFARHGCETMAAVNASRNRFIVCRQCLEIRGDTPRRAACGLSLVRRFAVSSYSRLLRGRIGAEKKKRVALSSETSSPPPLSVTRKSSGGELPYPFLSSPRFFVSSMNGKTRSSNSFNDHYQPFRHSFVVTKEFPSCYYVYPKPKVLKK